VAHPPPRRSLGAKQFSTFGGVIILFFSNTYKHKSNSTAKCHFTFGGVITLLPFNTYIRKMNSTANIMRIAISA
jgi:hypothetical protein